MLAEHNIALITSKDHKGAKLLGTGHQLGISIKYLIQKKTKWPSGSIQNCRKIHKERKRLLDIRR